MAGFKTHITVSTTLGVAYGVAGSQLADMPLGVCMLATGLCSVSGMLPDLDSDSGVPLRESLAFAAAVVPMLMIPRWRAMEFSPEAMVLLGSVVYLFVRFGVGKLLKKYTVHRGMFHSLPAALIATEIAFLVYSREDINLRYFVSLAVAAGFMSHLILDEIWSIGVKRGQIALKKSFGTAFKLWGDSMWANFSCYGKLVALSYLVLHDPVWMYNSTPPTENIRLMAQKLVDRVRGKLTESAEEAEEELPPMRQIPRQRYDDREIPIESPARSNDQFGRSESNWREPVPEEPYERSQPPYRDYRSGNDQWRYQR
jgi:hypothetical protein